ncbi:FtsX-like permease family protein [Candidatus Galacturonibacter soehngenii]|uniref:ABC transporter permease n=1 Tax=Candidatus Galacturonatibacter soehngenii TaxID=2307010 RepID=A0A7V7QI74_9FIRM|nr:FtsX-like permease family protein [Candidatus Galacturonibacter soehngenii]KAB1435855.1 ABC transporter permease [Candidatus Galacturonibacter soehngenii]MBA4686598.1 ABC transporter permease [Candidatus Galacturonibacter soehngenii]
MNLFYITIKNISITKSKLIMIILIFSIGLAFMNIANNISESSLGILKSEYKDYESNRLMRISSGMGRELNENEIEYIKSLQEINNVSLDYYLSLVIEDENRNPIYKTKVQEFNNELAFDYNYLDEDIDGIIVPNISVYIPEGKYTLSTLIGKKVFFEIERVNEYGEAIIIPYQVYVRGSYETNLDEYTASVFVSPSILEEIYRLLEEKRTIYECSIEIKEGSNIYDVAKQIEEIGLETNYKQKSYKESKANLDFLILFIKVLEFILISLGGLCFILFVRNKFLARKKEFGILKLLGYSNWFVTASIFFEILVYFICAVVIGIILYSIGIDFIIRYNLMPYVSKIGYFTPGMFRILFKNIGVISSICAIICIVIYYNIKKIAPLQQLRENEESRRVE